MVGFGIVLGVLLLLMLAVLELNKNTILGFVLLLLVAAAFVWLFAAVLHKNKWYYKLLGWLCFIGCFIGILFLTWPPTKRVPAYEGNTPVRTGVVETNYGQVRGVVIENGAVELYAGVPFAKPPVGELRWREDRKSTRLNSSHAR